MSGGIFSSSHFLRLTGRRCIKVLRQIKLVMGNETTEFLTCDPIIEEENPVITLLVFNTDVMCTVGGKGSAIC